MRNWEQEHDIHSPTTIRTLELLYTIGNIVDVDCKPFGSVRMIVVGIDQYDHLMLAVCRESYQPKPVVYQDWMANG